MRTPSDRPFHPHGARSTVLFGALMLSGCGVVTRTVEDGATDASPGRESGSESPASDRNADRGAALDRPAEGRRDAPGELDGKPDSRPGELGGGSDLPETADATPGADGAVVPVPSVVGKATTSDAKAVAVSGSYAYVADSAGLVVVDVSTPATPKVCKTVSTYSAQDVAVSGSAAYVADEAGGLVVVDVSTPCSAKTAGSVSSTAMDPFMKVVVSGSTAYILSYVELVVVDVSNPASPKEVGTPTFLGSFYWAEASTGTSLLLAGIDLAVVNVSSPSSPVVVGTPLSLTPSLVSGLALTGAVPGYTLVAVSVGIGIEIDDASTTSPAKLSAKSGAQSAVAIRAGKNGKVVAYVTDTSAKIERWDITVPAAPVKLADTSIGCTCEGIALDGTHAYLACGSNGLLVLDGILP